MHAYILSPPPPPHLVLLDMHLITILTIQYIPSKYIKLYTFCGNLQNIHRDALHHLNFLKKINMQPGIVIVDIIMLYVIFHNKFLKTELVLTIADNKL